MNLFKGLMFLGGHFVRPEDIDDDFAPLGNRTASARFRASRPGVREAPAGAPAVAEASDDESGDAAGEPPGGGLLRSLLLPGARPMYAGRDLDIVGRFEDLHAANDAADPRAGAAGEAGADGR